VNLLKEDA
jgi:magnesium-transporting ATPase (P-type)